MKGHSQQLKTVLAQILPVFPCLAKLPHMLCYHVKTTGLQCTTRIIWRPTSLEGAFKQAMGTLTPLLMQSMPLDFTQLCSAVLWLWQVCSHLSSYYFHQHLCLFHFKLCEAPTTTTGSKNPFQQGPEPHCSGTGVIQEVHPPALRTQDSPVPEAI